MNLAGLIQRPTRDVDVLGLVKGTESAAGNLEHLPGRGDSGGRMGGEGFGFTERLAE